MGDFSYVENRIGIEGRLDVVLSEDEKQKLMIMVLEYGVWDRQRNRQKINKFMEVFNGIRGRKNIFEMYNLSWMKDIVVQRDRFLLVFFVDD